VNYSVLILPRAESELSSLPHAAYERIKQAISELAEIPRPQGCVKLRGRGGWRIRVGDYRVIYDIQDAARVVIVLHIGHRRDIYR
jgi:mRNA interferase RelE/StbE